MAQALHILHISTPVTWRGGEQQAAYLVEELQQKGIQQSAFCARNGAFSKQLETLGIKHQTAVRGISSNPIFARKLARYAKKTGATLLHCHDSHALTFAWLAAVLFGCKLPIVASRRVDFPIGKGALSLKKYNHPQVQAVLCVSNAIRDMVRPSLKRPEVAQTVYSGVDLSRFLPGTNSGLLRSQFGIAQHLPLVGIVAALADHKDYPTWLRTVRTLVDAGCNAHFVIVGNGPMENEVKAEIERLQLGQHVTMAGFRNDVPEVLPELDVFLFTSKTEGLGTSIIDALASGTPVVATRAGGIPEIIEHGQSGLLAPVGDAQALAAAVQQVLSNADLRSKLVAGGLQRAQAFSRSATANATLAVYRSIAE